VDGPNGQPITIPDLWSLTIGNGTSAGSTQEIYFTAGANGYQDGLLGAIELSSVPEPSSAVLGLISVGLLAARRGWKKHRSRATD
jgi:MYXO-CTERM domain-containing protein